jgi:uncharacterized protein
VNGPSARRSVAVIGSGVSGLVAARALHDRHDVVLFEAEPRIGGHVRTIDVDDAGVRRPIDTGFIVYNERTYPTFTRLLAFLGVATRPTDMSFGFRCEDSDLQWSGRGLRGLFAQKRNLARPRFWRMVFDLRRFNRAASVLARAEGGPSLKAGRDALDEEPLEAFARRLGLSRAFLDLYLLPMGAAIWSSDPARFGAVPARWFSRFFLNHGLLSLRDRPVWRTIVGGSRTYAEALAAPLLPRARLGARVAEVRRADDGVFLRADGGAPERFDVVVFATHSDQALAALSDPSDDERATLGAIPYVDNDVVLHDDASLLPRLPSARASWNFHGGSAVAGRGKATVTYWMIDSRRDFCTTLNRGAAIDPARVIDRGVLAHPVYDRKALAAQARASAIDGVRRTYFCGAWRGYGFHEDGVVSALRVARALGSEFLS